jgi:CelD/BcsL family acetyltransferase involved in cellulose biosynthesis
MSTHEELLMTPRTARMRVDVVSDYEGFAGLRDEWRELLAASADRSPFLSWEWADAWWRTFRGRDRLHVVVVRRGEQPIGIAPWMRCGGLVAKVPPVYVGIGQESADYGGVLLGADPETAAAALLGHAERLLRTGGSIVLARLPNDGDLLPLLRKRYAAPGATARVTELFSEEYPYLDLAGLPDPGRHVSRAWKKNDVRRRVRRLSETSTVEFVHHRSPAADLTALQDFFDLHDARWSQKGEATGAKAAGLFASSEGRRFVRTCAQAADEAGFLRLSFVNVDGKPIAARYGFEYDGRYYGLKSAFDPAMSTHGPGHMVVGFLMQQAVEDGLTTFDFMRGAGAHKHAWTDTAQDVGYYLLHRNGKLGDAQRLHCWNTLRWRNYRRFGR